MRILLVQHHNFINGTGGTEKICSFLASQFAKLGHDTHIATNQVIEGEKAVFPLDKNVHVTNIYSKSTDQIHLLPYYNYPGKNPLMWLKFKLIKKFAKLKNASIRKNRRFNNDREIYLYNLRQRSIGWKRYIDDLKPDIIITMSIGSLLEISYQNSYNIPIINSTNGRPDYDFTDVVSYRNEIEKLSLINSFTKLDAIQVLFDSYHQFLPKQFQGISQTIANPIVQIDDSQIVNHVKEKKRYKIINLATLTTACKQQHLAIEVFAKIKDQYPDWNLEFWGVGKDYKVLKKLIEEHALCDRVFLKGFTEQPKQVLKQGDIFLFLSKYEGFPLALGEAMSIGLPCIGFANCSGVNELIEDQETGFLAKNLIEVESVLKCLISNPKMRHQIGKAAHDSMKNYQEQRVFKDWEKIIQRVVQKRKKSISVNL